MKGLLIKDLMLMKMQWRFFAVVLGIAVIMGFTSADFSFILGYVTFLIPIFSISTISYDEFDNGMSFIFTLPVTRKMYIAEKYLFSIILGAASSVLALLISGLCAILTKADGFLDALSAYPIIFVLMLMLVSLMLPLQLKFGAEKARIAVIIIGGGIFILVQLFAKAFEPYLSSLKPILVWFSETEGFIIYIALFAISAIAVVISTLISNKIINKKEF